MSVRPWFSCNLETWNWFINEPLIPFGNLTPSAVINEYGEDGIEALIEFIFAKEMGGFD